MSRKAKPILCLDFDGVVHSYELGWSDGTIYGSPTKGFQQWAEDASEHFLLVIHSSRSATPDGLQAISAWLKKFGLDWIEVSSTKPPAYLTIDDRCITFRGIWKDLDPAKLAKFKPWGA